MSKKVKKSRKSKRKPSQKTYRIKNVTISVCMIVKDEEQFLDNCLKSVKDIADEIIIVDTGSTDSTVDIAKKYTDKIFFHPWQDNFSEARNHCLKYATGDWIFQIDADEELVKKDLKTVSEAVKNPDIDAIMVQIISTYKKGEDESRHNAERIFRNDGVIHYEGRVHNRLAGIKNPKIYPIGLLHYGYDLDDAELSEKKHQRRVKLLKQDIKDDPNNPLPYHYLGCCYLPKGQYNETLEVSLKAIELAEQQKDENPIYLWSRYNASMAYYMLKDYKNAVTIAEAALKISNIHIDSYFVLTLVNHELKKWDDVILYGEKYIKFCKQFKNNPKKFGIIISSTLGMDWNALFLMGISYYEKGNIEKSEELFQKAATKDSKKSFHVFRAIGIYLNNKKDPARAKKYLEKADKQKPDDPTVKKILSQLKKEKISGKRQTVSCCMIVKNEEKYLDKCLASVKDYVDELIIVDTGSTDSTVDIAKKYTDKIYFHPWENNFSKARNQALSYATCDWIFQIDGDEELMEGSGERLLNTIKESGNKDAIFVSLLCSYANGAKTSMHHFERLFRNNGIIHYEGRVHNRIIGYKNPGYSQIELWHYGYVVDEEKAQEKFERTTGLLKKDIEEDSQNPLSYHYLSASYMAKGMFKEALKEAQMAIQLADKTNNRAPVYSWTYFITSMSLYKLGRFDEAQEYSLRALNIYPNHLDSYYMLTMLAGEKQEWDNVHKFANLFIDTWKDHEDNPGKAGLIMNNTMSEAHLIYILMGHAYHSTKEYKKMDECYQKGYEISDQKWQSLLNNGVYHMDKSFDMDRAGHFLKLAVKEAPEEYSAWYMLAKYYNKCGFKNDEISALEKIIEIGAKEDFIFNRLFKLYFEDKLHEKAFILIDSIKNIDSSFYPYLLEMGNSRIEDGELESAFQCYMKAAEIKPDSPEAWSILAEITYSLGKLEDSQIFLEKALELKGEDLVNLLTMCEIKLKMKDFEAHIDYCNRAMKSLGMETNRIIGGFSDLKDIFIAIDNTVNNESNYSSRINNIISELDIYIDSEN